MPTEPSKAAKIRAILRDPLYINEPLRAIARFTESDGRTVARIYQKLLEEGVIAPRPVQRQRAMAERGRALESAIEARLRDSAWQTESMATIATSLGVCQQKVAAIYRQLRKRGLVPGRRASRISVLERRPEVEASIISRLLDPSFPFANVRELAIALEVPYHVVQKRYHQLRVEGRLPRRPPRPRSARLRKSRLNAKIIAWLMDPAARHQSLREIGRALGASYWMVRLRHKKLVAGGQLPPRTPRVHPRPAPPPSP